MYRKLLKINHHTALQCFILHLLKNLGQFVHLLNPIARLHNPPRRKIHALNGIPSITDRHRRNGRLLEHQRLRITLRYRLWLSLRHTNTHDGAAEPQKIQRLRIRLVARRAYDHRARAQAAGRLDDFLSDALIIVFGDVDEAFGAAVLDQLFFGAVVDADHAHRHPLAGQLGRDMAEAAARAGDDDPLPGFGPGFAQGRVGGYAGAEHRRRICRLEPVRDWCDIVRRRKAVLLERPWRVIPAHLGLVTQRIRFFEAGRTTPTRPRNPLNPHAVADLNTRVLSARTQFHHFPHALMAPDLARRRR